MNTYEIESDVLKTIKALGSVVDKDKIKSLLPSTVSD